MNKLLVIFAILFIAATSKAAFMAEPYAGYGMGVYAQDFTSAATADDKGDIDGIGLGARLGYSFPLIFFGADVFKGMQSFDADLNTNGKGDVDTTNIGVFAGVSIPLVGLRAWAGYYISAKSEFEYDSGGTDEYEGVAYKLGVGWKLIPFLSLNAELIVSDFDEIDGRSLSSAGLSDAKSSQVFVSLSAPLSLF